MKHKNILPLLLPILLALIFLSLPASLNTGFRDKASLFFSSFFRLVGKSIKEEPLQEKKEAFLAFLTNQNKLQAAYAGQAKKVAKTLQPVADDAKMLIGHVLYRSVHTWNSTLWIDVGQDDNKPGSAIRIDKNSPVLCGDSVVGVVEFVGKKTSLVRLISDSSLTPSVRIARGGLENKLLHSQIDELATFVQTNKNSFKRPQEEKAFLILLDELKQKYPQENETHLLAKGELQGHSEPLWRTPGTLLHGVGFNYDFSDDAGPARDLRTGEPIDPENEYTKREQMPLLQVGDLLVTSGLDGIFPEGLKIARVHSIKPLREGAFSYELLAKPTEDLLDLQTVFVLPPHTCDPKDAPTKVERLLEELSE